MKKANSRVTQVTKVRLNENVAPFFDRNYCYANLNKYKYVTIYIN